MNELSDTLLALLARGARLLVYLFLRNHPEGLTQRKLEILTGSTDKTISSALEFLREASLATRALSSDGEKRWFCQASLQVGNSPTPTEGDNLENKEIKPDLAVGDSPTPIIIKDLDLKLTQGKEIKTGVGISPTPGQPSLLKTPAEQEAIWAELGLASILRNERTKELVQMAHITPEYVRAKRLEFKADKRGGPQWAGLLLNALEQNQPAPELNTNGHLKGRCDCEDCRRVEMLEKIAAFTGGRK